MSTFQADPAVKTVPSPAPRKKRATSSPKMLPIAVPNDPETAVAICRQAGAQGVLFTGGNDLVSLGGDAPERDATETRLLAFADAANLPAIGVCRGMQLVQAHFGVPLRPVDGHVAAGR